MTDKKIYFSESFNKSISSLFRDFYKNDELSFLEEELWKKFQESDATSPVTANSYKPEISDPLLRLNLQCLTVTCKSMPFFASKIRTLFQKMELPINRSIHFHPEPGKELYYIEIQTEDQSTIDTVLKEINTSFMRVLILTQDFPVFVKKLESFPEIRDSSKWPLLEWLLGKGFLWEGSIFISGDNEIELFGEIEKNSGQIDWLRNRTQGSGELTFDCLESENEAFLDNTFLYYISFIEKNVKILLAGSFTQYAQTSGIKEIPFFKERFENFLKKEKIENFSGLGRTVRRIFNSLPLEILFLMPESSYLSLYKVITEQSLKTQNRSSGIVLNDDLAVLVTTIPEKNWLESKWKETDKIIRGYLPNAGVKSFHRLLSDGVQGYHLVRSNKFDTQILFGISSQLEFIFRSWKESLCEIWEGRFKTKPFPEDLEFRNDYITTHDPEKAIFDLDMAIRLNQKRVLFSLVMTESKATLIQAITGNMEYALSSWVNALTSFGLSPISQRVYRFTFDGRTFSKTEFFVEGFADENNLYERLMIALEYTMHGSLAADSLSGLILTTKLDTNGIFFLKSMRDYCLQTNPSFKASDFNEILLGNPIFSEFLFEYFHSKFSDGKIFGEEKLKQLADLAKTIREDEVLNSVRTAVLGIIRTNFFGTKYDNDFNLKTGTERGTVAYKIDSSIPISLPQPRPFREIYVYSSEFQGIHLRGGPVARGGLRYSDRPSDFRTEILSLMKTQMIKNTVIVPVGSKGGFVLSRNQYVKTEMKMVDAYKTYVESLLSLTDNRKGSERISFSDKNGPFAYDEFDPYLVVAADKGTAQLSDTANEISMKRNFWLLDAFASGGSRGYSHKDLGITAKGALVCADRHLRNLDIDYFRESITVAGIGDLGGDVFGNGLINSQVFKLVAAFNHKHIFLDPQPDPEKSYQERKRLFFSKSSGWDQYDKKLISKGGGVYDKTDKSIQLSDEIQKTLGISESHLSGQALITAILKAPVDLLYNGGIGTYIKSESEDNSKVGDPANNEVRINGSELRAKVVCEGGNLGLTQPGRIEYALNGGHIYTDALDNSAGVDLSDHEVNLKIFFSHLKENGKIKSDDDRDIYLKDIAHDVCRDVLLDNALQSLSVDTDSFESAITGWEPFVNGSQFLIKSGSLNAITEKIPLSQSEWDVWKKKSKSIPKPVLCVLLGHAKMDLYSEAIREKIFTLEEFHEFFLDYFPAKLVNEYRVELAEHPLQAEILTTQIVNFYINLMGFTGILLLGEGSSKEKMNILKEIIEYLYAGRVDIALREIANLRDKTVEKENVQVISDIRNRIRTKWGAARKISLANSKLDSILSESSKKSIFQI